MDTTLKSENKKPKVMVVANAAFTIVNFRSELINDLIQRGCEVVAVCPADCNLISGDNIGKIFKTMGVLFRPINFDRSGINPLTDLAVLFNLIKVIRREKPDVVLNYTIKATIYGSIAAWLCNTQRVVSNITGLGYIFTNSSFKARFIRVFVKLQYKIALRLNDVVFFQNSDDLALFCRMNIIHSSIATKVLNGSGVNLNNFAPNPRVKKVPQSFLFVGRLIKDKGVIEFIEAAKKIKRSFPFAKFSIVGALDENPTGIAKCFIDEVVAQGVVDYVGSTSDVLSYLQRSEVFVLPSYREGTPRSVLEAMAVGLPIITTDVPGCRQTVSSGLNGILVAEKNVDSLYSAMFELINNSDLRSKMGAESLLRAKKVYDVNKVNLEILKSVFS